MAFDYDKLREENVRRFGTDIARVGKLLLEERYDERAHFILELLQNAEDALAKLPNESPKNGRVTFSLESQGLRFSHFGKPFDEDDIRSICGIGESTKSTDPSRIGRFGIGFKSVYAVTACPEIHSGDMEFAIENYVWPKLASKIDRGANETVFWFQFKSGDEAAAFKEMENGFGKLPVTTLLFLHQIEEIHWSVLGQRSATYRRSSTKLQDGVSRTRVEGERHDVVGSGKSSTWIIFRQSVSSLKELTIPGSVEAAFLLDDAGKIVPRKDACLAVFFPTVVGLGFGVLCQGPYRTTPSRDNVLRDDSWNQHLVKDTARLLQHSLVELRKMKLLTSEVLASLPIDRQHFQPGTFFEPLFKAVVQIFQSESLIPTSIGGFAMAGKARLGRTSELRELFSSQQLAALLGEQEEVHWVSGEITRDRHADVRSYLMTHLGVPELDPGVVVGKLTPGFLAQQSDEWMVLLYCYLNEQEYLRLSGVLHRLAIVRLEDGSHVAAINGTGLPQAFLPSTVRTNFATVRRAICTESRVTGFLRKLGLDEPDPVDDVVQNILPKYNGQDVSNSEFAADFIRILEAYSTDSKAKQQKLLTALRSAHFVPCLVGGEAGRQWRRPAGIYQHTDRMSTLFSGIRGVAIADPGFSALREEGGRDLLEVCGTSRNLILQVASQDQPLMLTIYGLEQLLLAWPTFSAADAERRSSILWEGLCEMVGRRGKDVLQGTFSWFYRTTRTESRDAPFVEKLKGAAWISLPGYAAQRPEQVVLEDIKPEWERQPFLQAALKFKPRIVVDLAIQAGIDPAVIDLLKATGLTNVEALRAKLGLAGAPVVGTNSNGGTAPAKLNAETESESRGATPGDSVAGSGSKHGNSEGGKNENASAGNNDGMPNSNGVSTPRREFVSYIRVSSSDETDAEDSDGHSQGRRLEIEREAIKFIRSLEPQLHTTSQTNPGFDLYEGDSKDQATRYVEVKGKSGAWVGPVTMSVTQFQKAINEGEKYWLYVVENVSVPDQMVLYKIHNPASLVRYFSFDRGWVEISSQVSVADQDTSNQNTIQKSDSDRGSLA